MRFTLSSTLCFTLTNGSKNVSIFKFYIWFSHDGEVVFFFRFVLVSSVGLRGRDSTVSSCLSAEFLPNISYRLSSLRSIVFGLCFGAVFCLQDLLLTQVQRWTKITSPSTFLCPFSVSLFFFGIYHFFSSSLLSVPNMPVNLCWRVKSQCKLWFRRRKSSQCFAA